MKKTLRNEQMSHFNLDDIALDCYLIRTHGSHWQRTKMVSPRLAALSRARGASKKDMVPSLAVSHAGQAAAS